MHMSNGEKVKSENSSISPILVELHKPSSHALQESTILQLNIDYLVNYVLISKHYTM